MELALELAESGSSPSLARNIVPGECSVAVWREREEEEEGGGGGGGGGGEGRGRGRGGGEGEEERGRGGTDEAQICIYMYMYMYMCLLLSSFLLHLSFTCIYMCMKLGILVHKLSL